MYALVNNKIYVCEPTPAMLEWCRIYLTISNPDYEKKAQMGLWTGNIPRQFQLYEKTDKYIAVPFGCLHKIHEAFPEMPMRSRIRPLERVDYDSHINLYDYQENAAQAILAAKNGILVMPCGAGKTIAGLEAVARIGMKTLWLTHTQDLMMQSMFRAKAVLGVDTSSYGTITGGKVNIGRGITFATVHTMCKIDLTPYRDEWGCIVTDECLPGETLIDTSTGKKELKNLCVDDLITSYNVISGKIENKHVTHVFKNKAHDIVTVKLKNGEKIVCTKNHPILTPRREWMPAERLTNDDYVLRLVWRTSGNGHNAKHVQIQNVKTRILLLLKGVLGKRRTKKSCLDRGTQNESVRNDVRYKSKICKRSNEAKQSDEKIRSSRKSIKTFKRYWISSKNKRRKRNRTNSSAENYDACACRQRFGRSCRISDSNKNEKRFWISNLLQGGYWNSGRDACGGSGRELSLFNRSAETGSKKRAVLEWVRVDGIAIQKQTSDGTFGGLCPDGYVYNIEVEDNNNYFANGILVHNCHHAVGSPTKAMQFYKVLNALSCRYKIGLTATPKRADGMERTMYALLGDVAHEVTREEVAHTTCPVEVVQIETGYQPNVDVVLCGDGTISYASLVRDLTENRERFDAVRNIVEDCAKKGSVLVLASRVDYLQRLNDAFSGKSRCLSGAGNSKAAKEERKSALKALNDGEIDALFASYQLAKEGLDVPGLRYVVFATPEKDPTTVVQSAGRVARRCEGKDHGTVIDLVDDFGMYRGWARKREVIYVKKLGYELK